MNSPNDADLEPEPETTNKVQIDHFRPEDAEDNLQMTPGDKLCEDELRLIFSHSWISPQDLLNFRLVSKSWRDAATATLLKRDALVVKLYKDSNRAPPRISYSYKIRRKKTPANKLRQLTELISSSKKFPSTNFRIQTSPDTFTPYTEFPDLMHFFKLHGDKIKTLRPHGWITRKCLLDILLSYTPTLEHLDLSKARITALIEKKGGEENALKWTSETLPFKSLTLRDFKLKYCEYPCNCYEYRYFVGYAARRELLHLLLASPSKLSSIENVTWRTLLAILTDGKGHLIRSFKYDASIEYASDVVMKTFFALKPTISKIALDLGCGDDLNDEFITSVNRFMQSFQNTVQNLTVSFIYPISWDNLLNIPPMKKLKSLTLVIETRCVCPGEERGYCIGCGDDREFIIDLRGEFFQFEDGISAENYFPSLTEVSLNSDQSSRYSDVTLMNFFSFKLDTNGSSANWNCLPKVDILSITRIYIQSGLRLEVTSESPEQPLLISQVFPNIRILKFRCGEANNLSGQLWALFPNVEFMEIYDIRSFSTCWSDIGMSHYVDEAFTGFTDQMLENVRRTAVELSCEGDDDLEKVKCAPRRPSICDLRHLKELKLKFIGKWFTEFASSVTGLHAFCKMPNTKFIISYNPETVLGSNKNKGRGKCSYSYDGDDRTESNDGDDEVHIQFSNDVNEEDEKAGHENENGGSGNDEGGNKIVENLNDGSDCKENGDSVIAKYEELVFGAIKPYVHIVHEKKNYCEC